MFHSLSSGFFFFVILSFQRGQCEESCWVPLGIKTPALPPDDRFMIEVNYLLDNYVPNATYEVILKSKDEKSKFIGFTISLSGQTAYNPENPKKPKIFQTGLLLPDDPQVKLLGSACNNTVTQTNVAPKTSVQAKWIAPPKGQGCVTIHAMVAIRNDMYYSGLTRHVCEDVRKLEDMPPEENPGCSVCEEARYKVGNS